MSIEPHFLAAYLACEASIEMIELLPDSDIVHEILDLLLTQSELFINIMEGKHFGTNKLNDFMAHIEEIKKQAKQLRNTKE
jgi:hypothetical protein